MTKRRSMKRGLASAALTLAAALSSFAAAAVAPSLSFEQAFGAKGEPAQLHYRVAYIAGGVPHRLEVWRDGDRHIRRATDAAILTYASRLPGEGGYRLSVLDLAKRTHTVVDRTNLYRIGAVTEWYDLGHGLRHPVGTYRIVRAAPLRTGPSAIGPCAWYDLVQNMQATRLCWSTSLRLPLLIATGAGGSASKVVWRVEAVDRRPIPASLFVVHDRGFVRTDANRDIESD